MILSSDDENETVIWIESESEKEDGDIMVLAEGDEGRDSPGEELAEENHEPVTTGSAMTQASVGWLVITLPACLYRGDILRVDRC